MTKWRDLAERAFFSALVAGCVIGIIILFLLLMSVRASAASCLTLDLQPRHVLYNYDGDTYTLNLDPFGLWHIREEGIDTPERNKKQPGWREAKDYTWAWLYAWPFQLRTCFDLTLGRVVGTSSRNGETLADALRVAGHVKQSLPPEARGTRDATQ